MSERIEVSETEIGHVIERCDGRVVHYEFGNNRVWLTGSEENDWARRLVNKLRAGEDQP